MFKIALSLDDLLKNHKCNQSEEDHALTMNHGQQKFKKDNDHAFSLVPCQTFM